MPFILNVSYKALKSTDLKINPRVLVRLKRATSKNI